MELFYKPSYFTESEIEKLKSHKYSNSGYSILDKLLNPFWELCAKILPYSLTPNMVTVLGLLSMASSIVMIYTIDNKFEVELTNNQYIFLAVSFFVYQTLDAIDGKHARNTKRSSPLGMLMDHGCDSLTNSFVLIQIFQAYKFKGEYILVIIQSLTQISFYTQTWEEKYTHVMTTQLGGFGVTELQFICIFTNLIPVFYREIHDIRLWGYSPVEFISGSLVIAGTLQSLYSLRRVMVLLESNSQRFKALLLFLAPVTLNICEFLVFRMDIFKQHSFEIVLLNGLVYAFILCKLIASSVSGKPMELLNLDVILYCLIIAVGMYYPSYQTFLFLSYGVFVLLRYLGFVIGVIRQLMFVLKLDF